MNALIFSKLTPTVADVLSRLPRCLKGSLLITALSGGQDSTALLFLLAELRKTYDFKLHAVHVNHALRAEASDADEAFCVSVCQSLSVPLDTYRAKGLDTHSGLEAKAREARYGFFSESYQRLNADALVLAHHADDQAETLLLHLLRGSGTRGLCGMREISKLYGMTLLRPLLSLTKAELAALQTPYRTDESNQVPDNLRNALRLSVMPTFEALRPGAAQRISAAMRILCADDDCLEAQARAYDTLEPFLSLKTLRALHPALRSRVLRRFAGNGSLSFDETATLDMLSAATAGTRTMLTGGHTFETGYRYLHLTDTPLSFAPVIEAVPFTCSMGFGDGKRGITLPEKLYGKSTFRTWQMGDFIRPFGMRGSKSMQDYFTDNKVDRPFRAAIPLLTVGNEVLWAPGIGASEKTRFQPGNQALLITAKHPMPWY